MAINVLPGFPANLLNDPHMNKLNNLLLNKVQLIDVWSSTLQADASQEPIVESR